MKIDEKTGGAIPWYHGEEILEIIPQAKELAEIDVYNFGNFPGPHMTPELMLQLSRKVKEFVEDKSVDGIIITHGTDTLEETSYLLDLTVKTDKPLVVIGAMKTSSEDGWDGPGNLMDALHICNNENSHGMGILVCLNGEINAASEVTKTHTEDLGTFHSLDFGALGYIDRGRVIYNRFPRKQELLESDELNSNVDLLTVYAGMDEKLVRFSADSGAEGIVIEALGVGNVPPKVLEGIKYAISKKNTCRARFPLPCR